MSIIVLIASLVADLALGLSAIKIAKAARESQAANTATQAQLASTQAQLLALATQQGSQINNHEVRIIVLEHRAAA